MMRPIYAVQPSLAELAPASRRVRGAHDRCPSGAGLPAGQLTAGRQSAPEPGCGRLVPDDVVTKHGCTSFSPAPPAARGEREQQLVALALLVLASLDAVELALEHRGPGADGHELVEQRREDGNQQLAQR